MIYLSSSLYILGPLSVGTMLLLLMALSRRLGEALEMPPYYRFFGLAVFFFLLPLPVAWVLLLLKAWGLPEPDPRTALAIKLAVASFPMTIAISFALPTVARYWNWIWGELRGTRREGGEGDEQAR
ncbi:hypothetical protein [Candidatus Solincola tengchongensis]|uniref:hypothetical protein n=1 Tax=Candidatus Solincola tengchongensis TaxID=2900693 RepID=UPI00257E35F2|nr:hypothetical protein [Candidatus Solincola tengchongensis]